MATNVFDTYAAVGIREDLTDVIYNISPTDTPFVSNVGSGSADSRYHEWQTDALAAVADTPVPEGQLATIAALTATKRYGNRCQINQKAFGVSGSDLAANNAGRGVEMAYQEAKKGLEVRRDIEYHNVGINAAQAAGTTDNAGAGTARISASIMSWIKTNTIKGTGAAADPTLPDGNTPRVDGTQAAFTEVMLTDLIDKIYLSGGDPDTLMTNTKQKGIITSTFNGVAGSRVDQNLSAKRIINAVDFYESDYGTLSIVPNRYMRQREVFVLDSSMWEIAYYRPFSSHDLAKTGDFDAKQMLAEWTLVAKNEASSGGIFDLT
jgi:hypothetical protein